MLKAKIFALIIGLMSITGPAHAVIDPPSSSSLPCDNWLVWLGNVLTFLQ